MLKIPHLRVAKNLNPVEPEKLDITRERKTRTVDVLVLDLLVESRFAGVRCEAEPLTVGFEQKPNRHRGFLCLFRLLESHSSSSTARVTTSSFTRRSVFLFFMRSFVLYFDS